MPAVESILRDHHCHVRFLFLHLHENKMLILATFTSSGIWRIGRIIFAKLFLAPLPLIVVSSSKSICSRVVERKYRAI